MVRFARTGQLTCQLHAFTGQKRPSRAQSFGIETRKHPAGSLQKRLGLRFGSLPGGAAAALPAHASA
jgi:hypothetical protein